MRRWGVLLAGSLLLLAGCSSPAAKAPRSPGSGVSVVDTITLPADHATVGDTAARSTVPPPPSSTPAGTRTATVLGSGDVLIHPPLWEQAAADARAAGRKGYDFGPMYASVAADVRAADLATCEMETPLAPPEGPFVGWPNFSAPPQVLTALTGAGYDTCTTASNHTLDQGYPGLKRTLDQLDAAGLRHTGSARSAAEADTPLIVTLPNGVRVGQLAFSFSFNGHEPTAGRDWEANLIDVPAILADARRMKHAGADIVVVSLHWGTEYDHLATQQQRDEATALLASPAIDLILGDHAHVVQPAQKMHGKWVFYCMGNQISRHAEPIAEGREGVMPTVTFTEVAPHRFRATSARAIPTWMQDSPALRLIDIPRALAASSTPVQLRTDSASALRRITRYLDAYGAVADGLRVG